MSLFVEKKLQAPERLLKLPQTLPNGQPWPKISVITPSFNQGKYIAETIESVIQQHYPNVEHIIIDGGSTDNTLSIINHYRSHLAYVVSERDKGQSDALNKGFNVATGEILCWLNSDDRFAPGALAAVAMAFATHDVDMVAGICEIYQDGQLINRHMTACNHGLLPLMDILDLDNGWNAGQFFYQPEVFFTRALWEKAGSYVREDCYYSMDYELWCRFAFKGARLHVIGAPLARFRMHALQKTADPSKFKKELVLVRDRFVASHAIEFKNNARPDVQKSRPLRVAMVNDLGVRHGAGIAHGRLAAGIEMAGHEVKLFDLNAFIFWKDVPNEKRLLKSVTRFNPDIVVFGNFHGVIRNSVSIIKELSNRFTTFWVTHDFWLFTGRCAYTGNCTKYLTGCDVTCPTAGEYPPLEPKNISAAWQQKRALLASDKAPYILGNSTWSSARAVESLSMTRGDADTRVKTIKLGVPVSLLKSLDKKTCRSGLKINPDEFVIAFSVSSVTEKRKGAQYLLEALQEIHLPNVTIILLGRQDKPFAMEGIKIIALGYCDDFAKISEVLSAADVYVGPSTEETFGQVFIEAAVAGTPSIGFDVAGVSSAIKSGITGLCVSLSVDALRLAITQLYHDRALCQSLGIWARIYALNEFTLESSYHSLFSTLCDVGVIDQCPAAHRIGFLKQSSYIYVKKQRRKLIRLFKGFLLKCITRLKEFNSSRC